MRAVVIRRFGSPDELELAEAPRPAVGPRDVLIEVHAAAVNPIDWKIREGLQAAVIRRRPPMILGMDASGVVVDVGEAVSRFQVGDEVFTSPSHKRSGTYAEYVAVDEGAVAHKPKSISHLDAAGIPLAGLTAWACLVRAGRTSPGDKVLVQAGSGGVGSLAVQIGRILGAEVSATCSSRNVELVRDLGAARVVDYTKERFEDVLPPQDLVLESLGGETLDRSIRALRRGGRLASINSGLAGWSARLGPHLGLLATVLSTARLTASAFLTRGIRVSTVVRPEDGEALQTMAGWIDSGRLRPVTDRVYGLDEVAEAHRYGETGRARGKIVLAVR